MAATKARLERELDRLYQLPLSEFTSARDELAKRLRSEGEGEHAEHVKQLRKPPAAVWLVNRLAHERELDVQRLAKAGEALAKSQVSAAAGESSQAFLDGRREEKRALEGLAEAAREIAAREGLGASALDRATQTLRAASLTDEGRELLKRGRLTEELRPPGFEALSAPAQGRPQRRRPGQASADAKDKRVARRRALKHASERVRRLRREEREFATAARTAEREAERAERDASDLRKQADGARAEADAAAAARAASERELEELE